VENWKISPNAQVVRAEIICFPVLYCTVYTHIQYRKGQNLGPESLCIKTRPAFYLITLMRIKAAVFLLLKGLCVPAVKQGIIMLT
jgi:hypothetical protein